MQQVSSDVANGCVQFWTDPLWGLGLLVSTVRSATVGWALLPLTLSVLVALLLHVFGTPQVIPSLHFETTALTPAWKEERE